jgi:erythromycin esterase-like protein
VADNKYGRVFTESDVEKILEWFEEQGEGQPLDLEAALEGMDGQGVRFKFEADEPLFILRGHDRRAVGAIRFYQDHQHPRTPQNHTDAIASAVAAFDRYREENPGKLKEPD